MAAAEHHDAILTRCLLTRNSAASAYRKLKRVRKNGKFASRKCR